MTAQQFLIAPFKEGLVKDLHPWLIQNDAFQEMVNCYTYEGRVIRKSGTMLLSRLNRIPKVLPEPLAGVATGVSTYSNTLSSTPVSPGTVTIRIAVPVAGWGNLDFTDNGNGTLTLDVSGHASVNYGYGTINYNTGAFTLYWDPVLPAGGPFNVTAETYRMTNREPVMGLAAYDNLAVNKEDLLAFDTTYSYLYNTGTNSFDEITGTTWNSTDSDFFWFENYWEDANNEMLLWVCNNIIDDPIRYWAPTAGWTTFTPNLDATPNVLRNCRFLVAFKDRLIALDTLEGPVGTYTRHQNRARWSQNGDPTVSATSWLQEPGRGGYNDAPTSERITGISLVKDTLIVFFENSTWNLRYTGNEIIPFVWERTNSELGGESPFSTITFDTHALTIGEHALIGAAPNQVERVDEKIHNLIYTFHNGENGLERVHGIRDYANHLALWTYPDFENNTKFPNRVLTFNYYEKTWSILTDGFTCFGRWQFVDDYTWETLPYSTWDEWTDPWDSPKSQSYYPNIVAGNQKGFVHVINVESYNDSYADIQSISSANPAVVTVDEHNLETGDFIKFYNTRAFEETVVNEDQGIALETYTYYSGTLENGGIFPGTLEITLTGIGTFIDQGDGTLSSSTAGLSGTINYESGVFFIEFPALGADTTVTADYSYNNLNYKVFFAEVLTANTFAIYTVNEDGTTEGFDSSSYGAYTGSGEIAKLDNFNLKTKQFNPLIETSQAIRIPYIDLYLEDSTGELDLNVKVNEMNDDSAFNLKVNPTNVSLVQDGGSRHWQRSFINSVGTFIQLEMKISDYQMTQSKSYSMPFEMHAMRLTLSPSGRYGVNA